MKFVSSLISVTKLYALSLLLLLLIPLNLTAQELNPLVQDASQAEKFIALWSNRIERSVNGISLVEERLVLARKDVKDQEKRLTTEINEASGIEDLIAKSGSSGVASERLTLTLQQIKKRRKLLDRMQTAGLIADLNDYRARRFELEDSLLGLDEQFAEKQSGILEALAKPDHKDFIANTNKLLNQYRSLARDEKNALSELISIGQQMQEITFKRLESLNKLHQFIRVRAFWLRDGKPLDADIFNRLLSESQKFGIWLARAISDPVRMRLKEMLSSPLSILYSLFLFPILPVALFFARQKVRAVTRKINDRVIEEGRSIGLVTIVIITGITSAALVPFYFMAVARLIKATNMPAGIGLVAATFFEHLALFLLMWFLIRSFFSHRSIAEVQFGMPAEAANSFHCSARWVLFAYVFCLLPWWILIQPPFEFEAMPRIFYTLFLIMAAFGVFLLVRVQSVYLQHSLSFMQESFVARYWGTISTIFIALIGAIILLDVSGYRYSSRAILESLAVSLALLMVLPPLFRRTIETISKVSQLKRPAVSEITGDELEPVEEIASRAQNSIRFLFVVIGVVLLARFWGLDAQVLQTLDEINIFSVRGSGEHMEFVTVADFVRAIFIFVATMWILRALPGLYEVALFPRIKTDEGVKYATLTISRYLIFVVGIFFALSEIHLDLGRLGWLMAAIGVGLGFGLQEIVSNFVSGIILLVERPVRPGDTVTIGDMSGKVQRINIRATTIMNFDRQEVLVPNRSLITSNVTNWTRSDTVNRLVISIGVAYGSDVDQVSALLLRIATDQPEVLVDPEPTVIFMNHGESSLDFNLRVFLPSPNELMPLRNRLNTVINKEFAANGIEIPFPQRDLHIRSSSVPLTDGMKLEYSPQKS